MERTTGKARGRTWCRRRRRCSQRGVWRKDVRGRRWAQEKIVGDASGSREGDGSDGWKNGMRGNTRKPTWYPVRDATWCESNGSMQARWKGELGSIFLFHDHLRDGRWVPPSDFVAPPPLHAQRPQKTVERSHTRRSFDRSFEDRSWTDGTRSIPRRGARFHRGGERGEPVCPVVAHGRSAFGTSTRGLRARLATMRFMVGTVRLIRTARVPGWRRISLNNS